MGKLRHRGIRYQAAKSGFYPQAHVPNHSLHCHPAYNGEPLTSVWAQRETEAPEGLGTWGHPGAGEKRLHGLARSRETEKKGVQSSSEQSRPVLPYAFSATGVPGPTGPCQAPAPTPSRVPLSVPGLFKLGFHPNHSGQQLSESGPAGGSGHT